MYWCLKIIQWTAPYELKLLFTDGVMYFLDINQYLFVSELLKMK